MPPSCWRPSSTTCVLVCIPSPYAWSHPQSLILPIHVTLIIILSRLSSVLASCERSTFIIWIENSFLVRTFFVVATFLTVFVAFTRSLSHTTTTLSMRTRLGVLLSSDVLYLNILSFKGAHVVSVNSSAPAFQWMEAVFKNQEAFGNSVTANMTPTQVRNEYICCTISMSVHVTDRG